MKTAMAVRLVLALAVLVATVEGAAQSPQRPDALGALVIRLQEAAASGNQNAINALGIPGAEGSSVAEFVESVSPAPARVVIKERDRTALDDAKQRLLLEVFTEQGIEGRVATWQADVAMASGGKVDDPSAWRIVNMERLAVVSGLYRLSLNPKQQFTVQNLTVAGQDLALQMATGSAFVADTPEGPTAIVLLGRGQMKFAPPDAAERTQVRIFSGNETLTADFDCALIRVRPSEFERRFAGSALTPRTVSGGDFRRANEFFEENVGRTLQIDLTDLSRDRWSLVPVASDLIAEVRTRKYGNLTYARVGNDAEDVSLFDRKRRKNISVYASEQKLAARGRFYSEDDLIDYDVLNYDIETAFNPERLWISGSARLTLKVRAPVLTTLTLRLADSLTVRSVYAAGFGRLLSLRVVGQNSLIVSLPGPTVRDTELTLQVTYNGRLESQALDNEAIALEQQEQDSVVIPAEPRFLYSNRSYWYPQSTVTDYATARLRVTVPSEFDVVASGTPTGPPAPAPGPVESGERARKVFVFDSPRPVRYLACVISRFNTVTTAQLPAPSYPESGGSRPNIDRAAGDGDEEAAANGGVALIVQANPRQVGRARGIGDRSAAVFQYYASLMGDAPYPSFTLAVSESDLPGGHSPGYFALLNQPLPTSQLVWRNDPVSFDQYPTFFLAHELAHQWWGQAVGWKNYHEQWLSEGFAQYFALLYAEKERGTDVALSVRRQMRRWAIDSSVQGPIYLGYRLGHIKSDGRTRRALLYNKGAMVLHMLRRYVGDESFFGGLRKFYREWRFRKAGTDNFRVAMEAATGRDLSAFFESWIYASSIPHVKVWYEVIAPNQVVVKISHAGVVIPVPVTVTLMYASGETEDTVVNVDETSVSRTLPLKGPLREVALNQDYGALVEVDR
jgi:hypothetical protein